MDNENALTELSLYPLEDQEPQAMLLATYSVDELTSVSEKELEKEIKEKEANLGQRPNFSLLEEFNLKNQDYLLKASELAEVEEEWENSRKELETLRHQRLESFMAGFSVISQTLKEMYQMITCGGNAELELVDSLDPFSEGIQFSVMPPKKSWKNISNLSGGEKVNVILIKDIKFIGFGFCTSSL